MKTSSKIALTIPKFAPILALALGLVTQLGHAEPQPVATIDALANELSSQLNRPDDGKVLIVTDLDNTLLELDRDIGSEHWFLWQKSLIDAGQTEQAAAVDVGKLLRLQTLIGSLATTHLVASEMQELYNGAVAQGHFMIGLTSRMIETRDITVRELKRNGMAFTNSDLKLQLMGQEFNREGRGKIFDPANPDLSGLTPAILVETGVRDSRDVAWSQGVLYTEGQNKGIMLAAFLNRSGLKDKIKSVIFIDDRIHHGRAVETVMAAVLPQITTTAIHLQISRPKVEGFERSDKTDAKRDFCSFLGAYRALWLSPNDSPVNGTYAGCL